MFFELFKQNPKLLFIFPLCILCDSQNFYNVQWVCHVTIYLSFIYPPICSSIYLFQKRRRETHTERREGHQNVFYIPNYYMLYWFLRAIVNYRSILSFQSEYPVLATWFLPVRNNSFKRRLISENTHYRHNYFFRKSKRHKVIHGRIDCVCT